jgi:hypothetical protein
MSVPMFNVAGLWQLPCDKFNEWRANTDLPLLYDYFTQRLPDFGVWAAEFEIDKPTFCHTLPTGKLFLGGDVYKHACKTPGGPHNFSKVPAR